MLRFGLRWSLIELFASQNEWYEKSGDFGVLHHPDDYLRRAAKPEPDRDRVMSVEGQQGSET